MSKCPVVFAKFFQMKRVQDELYQAPIDQVGSIMQELGFELLKMEDFFTSKTSSSLNPFKPHRIEFFTLLLLTEGKMTHEVDFIDYKMIEGDCLFISKDQIHKFDNSRDYKGFGIIFTEEFMLQHLTLSAFSKINFLCNCHLCPSLFKDFGDRDLFLSALKRELSLDLGIVKADVIACMLSVFLLKAQCNTNEYLRHYSGDYGRFMHFQKLVSSKYMQTRKASEYATFLNISYKQLNMLCKSFTNRTAKEYIDNYVVLQAKRLLATTELTIKHISSECGFRDETKFLKFFKNIVGITPAQFRETSA